MSLWLTEGEDRDFFCHARAAKLTGATFAPPTRGVARAKK